MQLISSCPVKVMSILSTLAAFVAGVATSAAEAGTTALPFPLANRARAVAELVQADPPDVKAYFSSRFLSTVSAEQVREIFKAYFQQVGECHLVAPDPALEPYAGRFRLDCAKGYWVSLDLRVSSEPPHLIDGLLLKTPVRKAAAAAPSLEAVTKDLAALPGEVSLAVARLDAEGTVPIIALRAHQAMAIGSVSKLFVLDALLRDIQSGKRRWGDVVRLPRHAVSLPSGDLQRWPDGSPLTLHTLAAMSISKSDNTATDALISTIGRDRVEVVMDELARQGAGKPFLTTREFFLLKHSPEVASRYEAADANQRRAILDKELARMSLPADAVPLWSATQARGVEWFASMTDLVALLMDLKTRTAEGAASEGRRILAINVPEPFNSMHWPFLGFKGGSEPGVAALVFLGQVRSGRWYAVASAWNGDQTQASPAFYSAMAQVLTGLE